MSTGLPLGRILVLNGALSDSVLTMSLEYQVRIRDGMSTREEVVSALAGMIGVEPISQEETMRISSEVLAQQPRRKGLRIGELMVLANLIQESDVMTCLEVSMVNGCRIGEVMVSQGYVSEEALNAGFRAAETHRRRTA